MRILHLVSGTKWTGPAAVTIDQVRALRDAGVEAEVAFAFPGPLAERFGSCGWARPLLTRPRGPTDLLADVARLSHTLDRERFEIIHCHATHDHWAASLATNRRRRPIVRTFHHARQLRRDVVSRRLVRACAGVAFSNGSIAKSFASLYGKAVPGVTLPPVVDTECFQPGPRDPELGRRFGLPEGAFVVGTIGKMARGRGHDAALRILARARHPEIVLLHVGKGELREELRGLAARLGVARRNFETGYQEELLPEIYRLMDAFLFTASGSDQGHRAVLEAMASGLPVVALPVPGIADFRLPAGPGFDAPEEAAAAGCLDFLYEHPRERAAMGRAARERSRSFEGGVFAARAVEFYAGLTKTGKKGTAAGVVTPAREEPSR